MRTLRHVDMAHRIRASRETLTVIAPIAHRLGLYQIKRELEDIALTVLRPSTSTDGPTRASLRLLDLTATLLPHDTRARWREEWRAEATTLPTRRARVRFVLHTAAGAPRLARTLGRPGRSETSWATSLARIARALGVGGAIAAGTAQVAIVAWIAGAVAAAALGLFGALLFIRSDVPASRLARLIREWRR
jgi:hypothetical protein